MKVTIIIQNDIFGRGNDGLGKKLMGSFLRKLVMHEEKPEKIIFYNSGVKLLAKGSTVLDALEALFTAGVDILACGTCIEFFDLENKIVVGRMSDMMEISSILLKSEKVVTV